MRTVDLANWPLTVASGLRWVETAEAGGSLSADDAAFVSQCRAHLQSPGGVTWEPTEDEWNRLSALGGEH